MLSPYLNSLDEEEQNRESLPVEEAIKIFSGEKHLYYLSNQKENAKRPFFKAKFI